MTQITGTYRNDLEVGKIYYNQDWSAWGETSKVTFKVIRECSEKEWREAHHYYGSLPKDPLNRISKYYELEALD